MRVEAELFIKDFFPGCAVVFTAWATKSIDYYPAKGYSFDEKYRIMKRACQCVRIGLTRHRRPTMIRLLYRMRTGAFLLFLISIALITSRYSLAKDLETRPLFTIERSKNANIVQYDVQVTAAGALYAKEPVIAYWVRLAKDGRTEGLSFAQRRWAYGFKASYDAQEQRCYRGDGGENRPKNQGARSGRRVSSTDPDRWMPGLHRQNFYHID